MSETLGHLKLYGRFDTYEKQNSLRETEQDLRNHFTHPASLGN